MNSNTSMIAREYRLQQWANEIRECQNRESHVTVKEWCNQHELTVANYYYHLREVRKACLKNIPEEHISQCVVPVSTDFMTQSTPELDLSIGNIQIHVTEQTSPELLQMVLKAASDVK